MQYCRGYYKSVCGLAHKSVRACLSAEGNEASVRCTFCANVLWSRTDSRTSFGSRTFSTSSYASAARKNTKTQEIHNKKRKVDTKNNSARVEVESSKIEREVDFFGLEGGPGVIDVDVGTEAAAVKPVEKYNFLVKRKPKDVEEWTYEASFGVLRYDNDNPAERKREPVSEEEVDLDARMHTDLMADCKQTASLSYLMDGLYFRSAKTQNDTQNEQPRDRDSAGGETSSNVHPNYLEEQFFGNSSSSALDGNDLKNQRPDFGLPLGSPLKTTARIRHDASNVIEEQYFPSNSEEIDHPGKPVQSAASFGLPDEEENHIEAQYFGKLVPESGSRISPSMVDEQRRKLKGNAVDEQQRHGEDAVATSRPARRIDHPDTGKKSADRKLRNQESDKKTDVDAATEEEVPHFGLRKKRVVPDIENPKTAFDYAMKIRSERKANKSSSESTDSAGVDTNEGKDPPKGKVDSFGFRIYSDQVVNLEKLPEFIVLNMLFDSALYNENDILALAKPYGLPVHPGAGHRHCLTKYLPDLAERFCAGYEHKELYTVHRLDKETTGVILLAKTQEMAKRLSDMFAKGEIKKTYWALTKGVPSPLEGIIDIPIAERTVAGKLKMILQPHLPERMKVVAKKTSIKAHNASTHFKVMGSYGNAALVELSPHTGVKHQLRVHLSSGLCCPVLGDHKYSHFTRLAPQKLPSDMLERFGMRQSKVRTLPMHLHARGIVLPQFLDGRNIIIGARLPLYFKQNMRRLKIRDERESVK